MIFLSSFPRSGNTFLRNVLFEVYGLESSEFHRDKIHYLDDNFKAYPFVKLHELPSSLHEFDPDVPAVYLVRDGRDSVCSLAHHRSDLVAPGSDYRQNLKEAIIADRGSFFGGWSRNAEEWLKRADLIIRFEDLIREPIRTVERLRKVYTLPTPIVENLPTFKALKFGIPKYGHGVDPNISDQEKIKLSGKFFRRGKTGGWKEDMPEDLHDLFWSYHGETMEKFGYTRSGEIHDPNPGFDHVLQAKLGVTPARGSSKKYRVLVESNKIVSPDNDGVKRYQVELLKALLPVVENPDSNWEIDLYIHGEIRSLLECKDVVLQSFLPAQTSHKTTTRISRELITAEHKLVAMVPRGLVRFLAKHNITVFHRIYDFLQRPFYRFIELVRNRKMRETINTRVLAADDTDNAAPGVGGDGSGNKFDAYDLVHIPLQQHYVPFLNTQNQLIITVHDLTHLHLPEYHTQQNISNADEGMKFAIDRHAHLIAVSQATKSDILNNTSIPESKVHRIYEAADRKKFNFKNMDEDCRKVREKYLIGHTTPYIICLSTLEPRKNLLNTIRAYVLLRQENPGISLKLVIAGKKGWDTDHIFSLAKEHSDHVLFTGFVDDDDLAYLYSRAVAMSYVSFYEGFGLPPLEAMCCGTPVIYGNNSSLIEVVGDGGLPADPYDVNDIKIQFERIFYDTGLRDRKARAALKQSLKFSWRDTALETLRLYKRIIDDNREVPSAPNPDQQKCTRRSPPDTTPVIHIGMPKTATKTMQWHIFAQHSEIYYLGRFDGEPFHGKYGRYNACRDKTVLQIMDDIAYTGFRRPEISRCRKLLEQYLAEHNQNGLVPVWSWESYSTDSRENRRHRAKNLKQLFVDAKIVITIRHPVNLLESAFLQQLKRDNIGGRYKQGKGIFHSTIDKWVARDVLGDVSDHLDYAETIRMYVEEFGRDKVCVLVYEDLLQDKASYYRHLCEFMGVDSQEALSLVKEYVENNRWTSIQLERLRAIDNSLMASLRFRFSDRQERKRQLDLDKGGTPLNFAENAMVEISQNIRDEVLARTRRGNVWLDQVFDLNLSGQGYY